MEAEIIPLPRRRLYRDYSDHKLLESIKGNEELRELLDNALAGLRREAKFRGLETETPADE